MSSASRGEQRLAQMGSQGSGSHGISAVSGRMHGVRGCRAGNSYVRARSEQKQKPVSVKVVLTQKEHGGVLSENVCGGSCRRPLGLPACAAFREGESPVSSPAPAGHLFPARRSSGRRSVLIC